MTFQLIFLVFKKIYVKNRYNRYNSKYVKPLSCFYNAATQNENNPSVARYTVKTEANYVGILPKERKLFLDFHDA